MLNTSADPERFNFEKGVVVFLVGREDPNKYHYKRTIIDPPFKWRFAARSMMARLVHVAL